MLVFQEKMIGNILNLWFKAFITFNSIIDYYDDKMMEHLTQDCYSPLKEDPTDSLTRKLDNVLKKLLDEQKIDKSFYDSCRTPNPRRPQLYGLPKIH